jgi:glutamine amidotransferase
MKTGILNYGIGNIGSLASALEFLKQKPTLVSTAADLDSLDALIIAGNGHYTHAMEVLTRGPLHESFHNFARQKKKPVLGICIGMQLFADSSEEGSTETKGLGWLPGKVVKLRAGEKTPHIGWVPLHDSRGALHKGGDTGPYYFMHSYHFEVKDPSCVTAWAKHGTHSFAASVQSENLFGVQFHPEKSQGDGVRLLFNFLEAARGF